MYFTNISNEELNLMLQNQNVFNFTIGLSEIVYGTTNWNPSNYFTVETIDNGLYRIYTKFNCEEILSTDKNNIILENECIICSEAETETYFTFRSNDDTAYILSTKFESNLGYDIGDSLEYDDFNKIVHFLRKHNTVTDSIKFNFGTVNGQYADYEVISDDNIKTITDNGILITDNLINAGLKIKLKNTQFVQSNYILNLKILHYNESDIDFVGNVVHKNIEEVIIPLNKLTEVELNLPQYCTDKYNIISFDASVLVNHDKPVIQNIITNLHLDCDKQIIQKGEIADIKAIATDDIGNGIYNEKVYFFEMYEPTLLRLTSDKSIIQTNDYADLKVTLKDEDGSLVSNEKVYFYKEAKPIKPSLNGSENVVSWSSMDNYTGDGVFKTHGSYLDVGWSNEGYWAIEFDYKYVAGNDSNIFRYVGLMPICSADINPFTDAKTANYAIDTWEGGFSFSGLGRTGWISSPTTNPSKEIQSDWTHLEIIKLSDTRLQIVINNTYEWVGEFPNLANLTTLYMGTRENPANRNSGSIIQFKNISITEYDVVSNF